MTEILWSDLSKAQRKAMLLFEWTDNIYLYGDNPFAGEKFLYSDCRFTRESAPDNTLVSLWKKGLLLKFTEDVCGDYWFLSDAGVDFVEDILELRVSKEFNQYFREELGL